MTKLVYRPRVKNGELARQYRKWHWGIPAGIEVEVVDPDFPDKLVEIGRLAELHIEGVRPYKIKLPTNLMRISHAAFDPDHEYQRIYFVLPEVARAYMIRQIPSAVISKRAFPLSTIAKAVGGRHGYDYPRVAAIPVGILSHIVYFTNKKGDGPSLYIHEMGEMGGIRPMVCVDKNGRFWLAGGSYTCPIPGITN